ncbi:hypothetical protein GCM10027021_15210 [Dyella kyungheensis]
MGVGGCAIRWRTPGELLGVLYGLLDDSRTDHEVVGRRRLKFRLMPATGADARANDNRQGCVETQTWRQGVEAFQQAIHSQSTAS